MARARVAVGEQRLELARSRLAALTALSRVRGRVVKVNQLAGSSVQKGQTLILIEPVEAKPRVDVYLTQEEVAKVSALDRVRVYVPAIGRHLDGRAERIDRTARHLDADSGLFDWVDVAGRGALVTVVLDSMESSEADSLTTGLPALVSFSTRQAPRWVRFLADSVSSWQPSAYASTED